VLELTAGPMIIAGKTTFPEAVIFATIGLTLGSIVSYYAGYYGIDIGHKLLGRKRQGQHRGGKAVVFIKRYGDVGILFAQLFGPARTWISMPAGALKMDIRKFILFTAIGGSIYCSIQIGISWALAGLFRSFYLKLLARLESPLGAGLIVGFAVLSLVAGALIASKMFKEDADV